MKNRKEFILVVAIILLPFLASMLKAESLDEIRKYFELRDTIGIVNLEMKRALKSSSRSPLLTKSDGTENLKRLILFLEHRIQEFSKIKTPLKYHYVRKLGEDFNKCKELYTAVVTKTRGSSISEKALSSPVALKDNYKLEPRPFFKPIDVRTILSPALAKSFKYTDKELARISSNKDKVEEVKEVKEVKENASASKLLNTDAQAVKPIKAKDAVNKVEINIKANDVATMDKDETRTEDKKNIVTEPLKEDKKAIVINTSNSQKTSAQPISNSTILVVPPPAIKDDKDVVVTTNNKIITVASSTLATPATPVTKIASAASAASATESTIIQPGKGKDIRIINKSSMRPLAMMVENHRKARPQTGLQEAEIVYEIPVEGGITRFMPLFFHVPGIVGPVRSCREYFVDRALEVKALYVHCGGSPKGYAYLSKSKINSIDEIRHSKPFYRYKGRRAPHNLYTKGKKVMSYMKGKVEMKLPEQRLPFLYGKSNITSDKSVKVLSIRYHGNYKVKYEYNKKGQYYERYMNHVKHIDKDSKKPIRVGTVIIQTAKMKTVDKIGRQEISFIGTGTIRILQAGKIIKGAWSKKTPRSFTDFFDSKGKSIVFPNKYPIWIQVVSPSHKVLLDPAPEAKKIKKKKKPNKKKSSKKKSVIKKASNKKATTKKTATKKAIEIKQNETDLKLGEVKKQEEDASKSDKKEGTK